MDWRVESNSNIKGMFITTFVHKNSFASHECTTKWGPYQKQLCFHPNHSKPTKGKVKAMDEVSKQGLSWIEAQEPVTIGKVRVCMSNKVALFLANGMRWKYRISIRMHVIVWRMLSADTEEGGYRGYESKGIADAPSPTCWTTIE